MIIIIIEKKSSAVTLTFLKTYFRSLIEEGANLLFKQGAFCCGTLFSSKSGTSNKLNSEK